MFPSSSICRTWLRLVGAGPLVLVVALLPSYLSIDHWGEYVGYATGHRPVEAAVEGSAEHTSHGMHCHYGPSSCSDQPAPVNGRVLPVTVELVEPAMAVVALDEHYEPLAGVVVATAIDPPRV